MSLKTTVENYKKAKVLFTEIDNKFYDLQRQHIEETEFVLNQLLEKVNQLSKITSLRSINIDDLKGKFPEEKIQAVKQNLEVIIEASYYWRRFFLGAKYAMDLKGPVNDKYIPGLNLEDHTIAKFGGSIRKVARKFIGTLTHTENVLEYENAIKRMILGTMTQKEFNRIFDVIRHKMISTPKKIREGKIPTFEEYMKYLNEDFFNPFDEDELFKEKKPVHISDKGGALALRKETFNLARIEYSKRPGGESTVLAKTQFARGEIIEICPVVILGEEAKTIDKLKDMIFEIDRDSNEWALVLGYGSLYRHSEKPNVDYAFNKLTKQMYFITKQPIKQGEELMINYGQNYWMERMTFNTITDDIKRTDQNQGMPVISGKAIKKNESESQPNAADMANKDNIRQMSSPNNPANPVISGVAIIGTGQS